ncbi:hypothetical protein KUCAC02_023028 [Chaenocephalus aceratus]|uniref:Uncharacterized protein n=1 Tax=Chaenocephalus aceratus TaxID=36190 RepID=A0ACB9XNW1_CHAAC|nr:hypothetical protein KUCAC02_023028 [Chaenocephalus aceratus]
MAQIHSAFGLSHRITATVTDNGSNFVKAFKMYAPPEPNEEEDNDEQGVVFTDVEELLATTEGQFSLEMIVPTSTRWNSFHDVLSRISDIPAQDLNTLRTRLDIRAPTEREHLFLKEYCSVLKPLTVALDILQGEDNCYYGSLLPTLETLMSRTLALQNGLSRMTANLPGVIVQTRFAPVLESSEALLAALTLPKCKVRWIGGAERRAERAERSGEKRREAARALLIAECRTLPGDEEPAENKNREVAAHSSANENNFFSFDEEEEDAMSISADSEINVFERLLLMRYNHTFCTDVE